MAEMVPATTQPGQAQPVIREVKIRVPTRHNSRLQQVMERVNADAELTTLWQIANVSAVTRLGMSDHGPVHVQIIANIALKLLRMLIEHGVVPNVVRDYGLTNNDAEVVVLLAALLHDIGMAIHRAGHEDFSLFLADRKLRELLDGFYDPATRTVISAEVLHAITAHRADGHPLTLEAGVVRVADALDMAKGRSRIPFEAGKINIHSVSATAIDRVEIEPGEAKPIRIKVEMSNSAGIFQLDELLKGKLRGSGLEPYVEVEATIVGEAERKLVRVFRL
jgi:hypothetical protein